MTFQQQTLCTCSVSHSKKTGVNLQSKNGLFVYAILGKNVLKMCNCSVEGDFSEIGHLRIPVCT